MSDRQTLRFVEDRICALLTGPAARGSSEVVELQVLLMIEVGLPASDAPDEGWKDSRIATPGILRQKSGGQPLRWPFGWASNSANPNTSLGTAPAWPRLHSFLVSRDFSRLNARPMS